MDQETCAITVLRKALVMAQVRINVFNETLTSVAKVTQGPLKCKY
jgi:hypothetical protein